MKYETKEQKQVKLREKLELACLPNVDVSIKIGDWLQMSDIILTQYNHLCILPECSDARTVLCYAHLEIPIGFIRNPKSDIIGMIGEKVSKSIDMLREKKDIKFVSIMPHGRIIACLSKVSSVVILEVLVHITCEDVQYYFNSFNN